MHILEAAYSWRSRAKQSGARSLFKKQNQTMPPIEERQKIAAILTTQDKVIELKEKRLAEKQRQKEYLMQQLLTGEKAPAGV